MANHVVSEVNPASAVYLPLTVVSAQPGEGQIAVSPQATVTDCGSCPGLYNCEVLGYCQNSRRN